MTSSKQSTCRAGALEALGGVGHDPRASLLQSGEGRPLTDDRDGVITVEILGQQYPVRSRLSASYVADLAAHVDQKMQTAAERSHAGDSVRVAVLAALNIADEYFRCRDGRASEDGSIRQRAVEIEAIVDEAIASLPTASD